MAEVKISALDAAAALDGTEKVAVVQAGETVRSTTQAIADLANTGMTISSSSDTTYDFVLVDNNTYIQHTSGSATSATIPTNASIPFPIGATILGEQNGAGTVTIMAAGGVTLQSAGGLVATNGQYATYSLVKKATNTWILAGNLT
jgi:hypothetical protein